MRNVSERFLAAVDADQRWAGARVRLKIINDWAQENAAPSTMDFQHNISDLASVTDGADYMAHKFTVLDGSWVLDGNCVVADETVTGHRGYWGRFLSDSWGGTNQTILFDFNGSSPGLNGLTLFFDDKHGIWAEDFTINFLDYFDNISDSVVVTGHDSVVYLLEREITGIYKISINFTKTNIPNRILRFAGIEFGIVDAMGANELTMLKIIEEMSPDSSALPYGVLEYSFENLDGRYDPSNPDGLYHKLHEGLPIDVELGVGEGADDIEYTHMGRYYFAESEYREGDLTATITANGIIKSLDEREFTEGVNLTGRLDLFVNSALIAGDYDVETVAPSVTVGKSSPIVKFRELLRQAAQAGAVHCFERSDAGGDRIIFENLLEKISLDGTIPSERLTDYPAIARNDTVKKISVRVSEMLKTASERSIIYEGIIGEFPQPDEYGKTLIYTGAASEIIGTVNGYPLEYSPPSFVGMYALRYPVAENQTYDIVLEGYRDEIARRYHEIETEVPKGATVSVDNPLIITNDIAESVADWLAEIYQRRTVWDIAERGNPAQQLGDLVELEYRGERNCVIIRQEFIFDGTLSAHTRLWEVGGNVD